MEPVLPGLWASAPDTLPFDRSLAIRSFLVQRDDGNLLLYRGDAALRAEYVLRDLGGVSFQYLNHWHEASRSADRILELYDAPLLVHRDDALGAAESASLGALFVERHRLNGDFEVIPTPGHTPGASAYLWDSGSHRILFTGDTIHLRGNEWVAAVLSSSDRQSYLRSLELIRDLDFDVLAPWIATDGDPYYAVVDGREARRRVDAILLRLSRGEDH